MKFNQFFQLVKEITIEPTIAKKELQDYSFDGVIEFSTNPLFTMDIKHFIVLDYFQTVEEKTFIKIDNNLVPINGDDVLFFQLETWALGPRFSLQDFFDKYKNAKCIVFYLSENAQSVFHEGYTIRATVITDELIENKIKERQDAEKK